MPSYHKSLIAVALQLPAILAYPSFTPFSLSNSIQKRDATVVWGAIGDSWASGVSYEPLGGSDYDGNKDECLRLKDAYSVQTNDNKDWLNGQDSEFHFAACSGSRLVHMIREPWLAANPQMLDVGANPRFVTMQAGGNDAGFYNVASNCIFHDKNDDFGGLFPDDGKCKDAINTAHNYLTNPNQDHWVEFDVEETIKEILAKDPALSTPGFHLYLIGYAHFFDVRDEATGCNDWSFNLPFYNIGKPQQKLNLDLRRAINDLTEQLNNGMRNVAGRYSDKVSFIDISPGFDDHRFCQVGASQWDQYFGTAVYLWNWVGSILSQNSDGTFSERDPTNDEFQKWLTTGTFTDDPAEVTNDEEASISSTPKQGVNPGSALRPFHPKHDGHRVMADAIAAVLKNDIQAAAAPAPQPTKAIQVVLHHYIDTGTASDNWWSIFDLNPGEVLDYCEAKPVVDDINEGSKIVNDQPTPDDPPNPNGSWTFTSHGEDGCTYSSDGNGPGTLDCPSFNGNKVNCEIDSRRGGGSSNTDDCGSDGFAANAWHPSVYCAW